MPSRVRSLSGARNFRDLGGYPTADGRQTRWETIFRSDKLSELSDEDLDVVAACGIGSVVDLRTREEQGAEPSRWRKAPSNIYASTKPDNSEVVERFVRGITSQHEATARMRGFYVDLPLRYREEFATIFSVLDKQEGATLVHCTAGKDRTGVACALVLVALGVDRRIVLEDYALPDSLVDAESLARDAKSSDRNEPIGGANDHGLLDSYPWEIRFALWRSNPEYLAAALDMLDRRYGSVEGYLEQELGVDQAILARLRDRLTVDLPG